MDKLVEEFPGDLPSERSEIQVVFDNNSDLAWASQRTIWDRLRIFWDRMIVHGLCESSPMLDIPAPLKQRSVPRVLTDEEVQLLIGITINERNRTMLVTLLDTGLRIGELASLTRDRVQRGWLTVNGKVGERRVPITPGVYDLLSKQGDEQFVWVGQRGPLTRWGCQDAVRHSMLQAGFRPPKIGPHTLRHTFGVHYIMNGGDAASLQSIMGHTKIETTMLYVQLSDILVSRQHRKYSPMSYLTHS